MTNAGPDPESWNESGEGQRVGSMGWKELWLKEDWWAIWLGLGIVIVACLFFANGSSIRWSAVTPGKWSNFGELPADFAASISQYLARFILWAIVMIFFLPLASRGLHLHTGVTGAWIGTSEFADAAAKACGHLAGNVQGVAGTPDDAVWGFTLPRIWEL